MNDVIGSILREEPQAVADLSQDVVRQRVRIAIRRATECGALSREAILRFVILMFALEPEFDQRYRVQQFFSSRFGSFDERILGMHEWSHPNCWYRAERVFTEKRWNLLTSRDESHEAPVVALSRVPSRVGRPAQLSGEYGYQLDVPYVETPHSAVLGMLQLAKVGRDDVVIDAGCGDGHIVIAAAKRFGARGIGIDLDPDRISAARANAERAGVSSRVSFHRTDLFDTDFSSATVVVLYLLRDVNLALREKLRRELPNGARVVSWQFDMGDWQPNVLSCDHGGTIYCWHIRTP